MTFIEFIGFIITLVAMFFIVIKRIFEQRAAQRNPEEYAERERQHQLALKKFYRSLEGQMIEEEDEIEEEIEHEPIHPIPHKPEPPPLALQVQKKSSYKPPIEKELWAKAKITYQVDRQKRESVGGVVINNLPSRRDMLIIKEIFDKPLAMRDPLDR